MVDGGIDADLDASTEPGMQPDAGIPNPPARDAGADAGPPPIVSDAATTPTDASAAQDAAGPSVDAGDDGGSSGEDLGEDRVERAGEITIGTMVSTGPGCPSGSVVADPTDRPMRFHLNLTQFTLQVPAGSSGSVSCSFELYLTVPAEISLRIVGGAWQGDYMLRRSDSSASFDASYAFDDDSARSIERDLSSASSMSFDFADDVRVGAVAGSGWTPCSAAQSAFTARANVVLSGSNDVAFSIRSADLFRIESQRCAP
jgi:hypothetical protein